jgi:UDP-2-acetamido-3-amino-2,3-dideoxy-glucuronate N-acetyltransferase
VVIKNVPAYALVVGTPAVQKGWMSEYGQRLIFDAAGKASCTESGQQYQLKDETVIKISD